jgi:hypothetical protein
MNSTNHSPQERSACEALFDQVERDLLALTTVSLDLNEGAPRLCVDEFANEFLGHWSMPPRRRWRS